LRTITKAELKEDIIDAGITSVATAFSSPLKLPAAGYRNLVAIAIVVAVPTIDSCPSFARPHWYKSP
jgi:hypothetical protein